MTSFPDESTMEKSTISGDLIRGGSIGFNRILDGFVKGADKDRKPAHTAFIISAFTILRNVWTMNNNATMDALEDAFIKDLNLFLEYYDSYLNLTLSLNMRSKYAPVILYFPDYSKVNSNLLREHVGHQKDLFDKYKWFYSNHGHEKGHIRKLEFCRCMWINASGDIYPHKDVARKFKSITNPADCLYSAGDPIGLITHMVLDLHISSRLRNVQLVESNTGAVKPASEFKLKLDKLGRVPFYSVTHAILGDSNFFKPIATHGPRKILLEHAAKENWNSLSEENIRNRISKLLTIPISTLRKFNFD